MQLTEFDRVSDFLDRAGAFLEVREAEHNLVFGICSTVGLVPPRPGEEPPSFAVVTAGDEVVAATLRTPPFNQVLSQVDDLAAVDLLVDAFAAVPLPGVLGPSEAAARFAACWTERTGQPAHLQVAERIFRLTRVVPPRPTSGWWRIAEPRDRELLREWLIAFMDEAVPEGPRPTDMNGVVDRWIARIGRTAYLWEESGRVVSFVGVGGATPNGIRIGPVYTPPDLRGRGYASSLTAAASQDQLDAGRWFCFLFTDLANPTSNKIYQAIGYEPVCDMDQYGFGR